MAIAERIVQPNPTPSPRSDRAAAPAARTDARTRTPARLGPRSAARTADGRLVRISERGGADAPTTTARAPRTGRATVDGLAVDGRVADGRVITGRNPRTVRTRRPTSAGLRAHVPGGTDGRGTARAERTAAAGPRPMPQTAAAIELELALATPLRIVPRRRRAARFAGIVCALAVSTMLGAAAFQTQLARRQVQLDQLDQDIRGAREQYDQLRRERAELRSPSRLSEIATDIGMSTATETDFMVMSPEVLAEVQQSTGRLTNEGDDQVDDPLEQFRNVKSVTDGTP